jgi:hypothetical protein
VLASVVFVAAQVIAASISTQFAPFESHSRGVITTEVAASTMQSTPVIVIASGARKKNQFVVVAEGSILMHLTFVYNSASASRVSGEAEVSVKDLPARLELISSPSIEAAA